MPYRKEKTIAGLAARRLLLPLVLAAGCVTAPGQVREREAHWREVLAEQVPVGTQKAAVVSLFERHDLPMSTGTYQRIGRDGALTSNCRLPQRAASALERSAVRGLYIKWDIEITVCLDEDDRVESHYVGAWNAGI